MSIITLSEAKKHLNIDNTFTDDDIYIQSLESMSEEIISNYIHLDLTTFTTLPLPLKHAMLLVIGNLYANRESISFVQASTVPYTLDFLLQPFINYD